VALREGITIRRGGGGVDLALSATGTLWYGAGAAVDRREVGWETREGVFSTVDQTWLGDFTSLALSPDGSRLAIGSVDATGEQIWVKQLGSPQGSLSKLTFDGINTLPRWHPDGKQILYVASFLPSGNIRAVRADGVSAAPAPLIKRSERTYSAAWSADGKWLVFEALRPQTGRDILAIPTTGDTAAIAVSTTNFGERNPSISPNGRWVVYQSNTTGASEVYARPFPVASAELYQVSNGGGSSPKWSRDGNEIFYENGNNELTRVVVASGASFSFSDRRVLFSLRGINGWDVAPGGQRFIVLRDRVGVGRNRLIVVENFFEELKAKVPKK